MVFVDKQEIIRGHFKPGIAVENCRKPALVKGLKEKVPVMYQDFKDILLFKKRC